MRDIGPRSEGDLYQTHELYGATPTFSVEDRIAQTNWRIMGLKNEVSASGEDAEKIKRDLAELDAKKLALLEEQFNDISEHHPRFVQALKDWLTTELMSRAANDPENQPVDDKMYVEAEVMADLIGELHEDKDADELEKLAKTMREIFKTERELVRLRGGKVLADSPSEHLVSN